MSNRSLLCMTAGSAAVLCATVSGQTLLYDNGPIITHPGDGPNGTDYSAVQTNIGQQASAFNVRGQVGDRMADDFVVPDGEVWHTDSVSLYTTNGDTPDLMEFMSVQIWDGRPNSGNSNLLWGNHTDNVLAEHEFSGIYRGLDIVPRYESEVMRTTGTIAAILGPGTYWIEFSVDTNQFDPAPNLVPVSILGERGKPGGNALWRREGRWQSLVDYNLDTGGPIPQDIAFDIHGTIVPAPGAATFVLVAGVFAGRRARVGSSR